MRLYRIEHNLSSNGMWNTFSAEGIPLVKYLDNKEMANLPMPYSDVYSKDMKSWFSAADSLELLHAWFKPADIRQLISMGFHIWELDAEEVQKLPMEYIFTKESVTRRINITDNYKSEIDLDHEIVMGENLWN